MRQFEDIPVLLIGYNRSKLFKKNLLNLKKLGLNKIFVFLDGPKLGAHDALEHHKMLAFLQNFDDSASIASKVNERNLGCKNGVTTAIDFFFNHNDFGLIVEDDVFIKKDFLHFVHNVYKIHNGDNDILTISSNSFKSKYNKSLEPYFYTKVPRIWGWATWRNSWKFYDKNLSDWQTSSWPTWFKEHKGLNMLEKRFWAKKFDSIVSGEIDTWDYQLVYQSLKFGFKNINPTHHMSSNKGFNLKATHTKNPINRPRIRRRFNFLQPIDKVPFQFNHNYDHDIIQ